MTTGGPSHHTDARSLDRCCCWLGWSRVVSCVRVGEKMDECRALDVALMVQLGGFRCVLGPLWLLLRDSWQLS